ncbi:hypothetical protein H4S14_004323 [Agrobacterium vitis]|nr:hypothetical protein [Agrobacterium vitis]MBE1440542.1 hypothetical protein [Agrobacterium vitis]
MATARLQFGGRAFLVRLAIRKTGDHFSGQTYRARVKLIMPAIVGMTVAGMIYSLCFCTSWRNDMMQFHHVTA